MFMLSKRYTFAASHVLHGLPDDHPCSRLHGHNYVVEVVCAGWLDAVGFVIDYRAIDALAKPLIAALDHRHLNDVLVANPTAEHLAEHLYDALHASGLPHLVRVGVSETEKTWAWFSPDEHHA